MIIFKFNNKIFQGILIFYQLKNMKNNEDNEDCDYKKLYFELNFYIIIYIK